MYVGKISLLSINKFQFLYNKHLYTSFLIKMENYLGHRLLKESATRLGNTIFTRRDLSLSVLSLLANGSKEREMAICCITTFCWTIYRAIVVRESCNAPTHDNSRGEAQQ